jgi:hypothetical protein
LGETSGRAALNLGKIGLLHGRYSVCLIALHSGALVSIALHGTSQPVDYSCVDAGQFA